MPICMRSSGVFALIVLSTVFLRAQRNDVRMTDGHNVTMTGNLYSDLIAQGTASNLLPAIDTSGETVQQRQYSPLRAGLYSAILPGAGQFYTKSYWQSAAFLGAEVIMWIIYANYESKGDRQTNDFQNYADANWSVVRYAYWIRSYYPGQYRSDIFVGPEPPADVSQPWNYINWSVLNTVEDQIGQLATTSQLETGFSHDLAVRPAQQYYEEIGKYPQFGGGWNDAASFKPGGLTADDVRANMVTPNLDKYSKMRGDANSFYTIATSVSSVIVANHVFSAVEAAWNASRINNRIHLQGHIRSRVTPGGFVEFVPTIDFEMSL